MCPITNLGAFGNFLRAILGIGIAHGALEVSPVLPPEVEQLRIKVPIRVAGREIYLDIVNKGGGYIRETALQRMPLDVEDGTKVGVPLQKLGDRTEVRIVM